MKAVVVICLHSAEEDTYAHEYATTPTLIVWPKHIREGTEWRV
jgi:hypothetical protein